MGTKKVPTINLVFLFRVLKKVCITFIGGFKGCPRSRRGGAIGAEIERSQCYPLQFPNSQDAQVLGPPQAPLESDLGIQYQNLKSVRPQGP